MSAQKESILTPAAESGVPEQQTTVHRFRFDRDPIDSIDDMYRIVKEPGNAGRTFQVTKEVFQHFDQKLHLLPNPPDDISRINRMLGTSFPCDTRMGMTGVCICPECGHNFSFADHVESVLRMGLHTAEDMKRLFTGDQYFLTVATQQGREMLCPKCDTKSLHPRFCYSTNGYAYGEL